MLSEDGTTCVDDNECMGEPCLNQATCINLDNGSGFLCVCPDGYTGETCSAFVQEKLILVSPVTKWIVAFVIINVIGKKLDFIFNKTSPALSSILYP